MSSLGLLRTALCGKGELRRAALLSHGSPLTCRFAWNLAIRVLFLWAFSIVCIKQSHPLGVRRLTGSCQQGECWEAPGKRREGQDGFCQAQGATTMGSQLPVSSKQEVLSMIPVAGKMT